MKREEFFSSRRITGIAVLLALVIVLQAALGTIQIGFVQLNFSLIPIVLGALLYGAIAGGILGFANGVVVLIQVIIGGGNPFYYAIWTMTPFLAALTCLVKATAAGFLAGWLFELIAKKNVLVGVFTASAVVPVVNTTLFILGCLCMNESINEFQAMLPDFAGMNIFVFILVGLVTFNFFIELAINLVVAPSLHRVIGILDKRFKKKEDIHEDMECHGDME